MLAVATQKSTNDQDSSSYQLSTLPEQEDVNIEKLPAQGELDISSTSEPTKNDYQKVQSFNDDHEDKSTYPCHRLRLSLRIFFYLCR